MNIAIIGSGNIGSGLALMLAKAGHRVVVSDTTGGAEAAAALQTEGAPVTAADLPAAVAGADLVILATPFGAAATIAASADFSGKTVIDVSNPVTADFSGLSLGFDRSAAEEIAALVPGARVVKAFNTIFASHYRTGLTAGGRPVQTFVAADDADARAAVIALAAGIGLDARDAGPLRNARYLEPLGYMNIQFGYMLGQGTAIAPAWLDA